MTPRLFHCSALFRSLIRTVPASSVPPPLKGCGTEHSWRRDAALAAEHSENSRGSMVRNSRPAAVA